MSVFGLKVEYGIGTDDGDASLQKFEVALERFGDNIKDFTKFVFPKVIQLFESTVDKQFDAQGEGPVSGKWAPLSAKYAAWKEIAFPGLGILERTGVMRHALTKSSGHAYREMDATNLGYGTIGVEYASFHQTGATHLPTRPPFDFGEQFESELRGRLQLGVIEAARSEGLELKE
jgi:phage gpG-like protein